MQIKTGGNLSISDNFTEKTINTQKYLHHNLIMKIYPATFKNRTRYAEIKSCTISD
ncbi:hypothetical protein EC12741_1336 [Escherichia coli 1.2741]|nr:hypothetical protein ECSTEC7V_2890 [Escherichia coli STEC_7v]EIG81727.1 hypothetical protein EC12741_1336 [Escherichia coli 1.2741]